MAAAFHAYWLPRRGNSPEEYEDAFDADEGAGRYALADGATESSFARLWGGMLVQDFVRDDRDPADWAASLPRLQRRFDDDVRARTLPWYGEAQREQGAFATLLGVVVTASAETAPRWQAVAVGDCCLFHTRRAELLRAFPLERAGQFSNVPDLVGSRASPDPSRENRGVQTQGGALSGDRLWMMTDALAHWCLLEREAGRNPWQELQQFLAPRETEDSFASWIEELGDTRELTNDDVTLLTIDL